MKIAVIGDIHTNSENYKLVNSLLHKIFDRNYDAYILLGDVFDAHYITKKVSIAEIVKYVEEPILKTNNPVIILAGNHDKKNDNYPSSINLIARNRSNVYHFDNHADLVLGNVYIARIPYLFKKEPVRFSVPKDKLRLCFAHAYIGTSPFGDHYTYSFEELKDFDEIFAGHFHINKYPYCGILLQNSFKDSGCQTGYIVYDTNKEERRFIELESRKFIVLDYMPDNFCPENFYKIKTNEEIDRELPDNIIIERISEERRFVPRKDVDIDDIYKSVINIGGSDEVAKLIAKFKVKNHPTTSDFYVKKLEINNIGSIYTKELTFERGKTYALVAPNKSGKTFILDSISFALIDMFVSRPGSKYNKIRHGRKEGSVRLCLSPGIVIEKSIDREKRSTGRVLVNGKEVCGPNISDVNDYLKNILDSSIYKNIIHADQFEYSDIIRMSPVERKEFIFDIIGIKELLSMREEFRNKYKQLASKHDLLNERINLLSKDLLDNPDEIKDKILKLNKELEELKKKKPVYNRKEIEKDLQEYERALGILEKAQEDKKFLEERGLSVDMLDELKKKHWYLQQKISNLSKLEKVGCYKEGKIKYPHCPLLRGIAVENVEQEMKKVNGEIKDLEHKIRLIESKSKYKEYFSVDIDKVRDKIKKLKEMLKDSSEDYDKIVNKISFISKEIGNLESCIDRHYKAEKEINKIKGETSRIEKDLNLYKEAVEILGKDKLPLYLAETQIPYIEKIANDFIKICEPSYSIRFVTKEGRSDTLEIYVDTPQGEYEVTELCGYEQTLVKIILRLSLLNFLRKIGKNYELLIIDETFDNVDTNNTKKIWEMIKVSGLQVIYVSHRDDVIDLADEVVEV